ncbi:MAG: GT4 family glycosyltransferase PelF [Litorilinea sp.]
MPLQDMPQKQTAMQPTALPQAALQQVTLPNTEQRLHVMMITEGTYPYHWGGVSTWCHLLLNDLAHIDFTLISLVGDPGAGKQFELPANVVDFQPKPLWGMREVLEKREDLGLRELIRRRSTDANIVATHFIPHFRTFLHALYTYPGEPNTVAHALHQMYRFFLDYDFDTAMRSQTAWQCFVEVAQAEFPRAAAENGYRDARYTLADLTSCMQWLYHWFFPIGEPLPKTDIVHAAMVGVSTLISVVAKLEHGAAYLLTEHGIYLRERYLAESATATSLFRKLFALRFANLMTQLSYGFADRIAPCCEYNHRWELRHGAQPHQLRTIYYGVDSVAFTPQEKPFGEPPVVVWVGRIDPLKDILTLLRAAALVKQARPDIEFRLFGGVMPGTEAYHAKCLELHKELGLESTVKFAGFRANPVSAFNEGDIVILTSVSEAFPFVVLEAMLCEKPVVATAVGGVPEQVEGCGIALEPRNPTALAEAILKLMNDPELCRTLGLAARQKAIEHYSLRQSGVAHENVYRQLVANKSRSAAPHIVATNTIDAHNAYKNGTQEDEALPASEPVGVLEHENHAVANIHNHPHAYAGNGSHTKGHTNGHSSSAPNSGNGSHTNGRHTEPRESGVHTPVGPRLIPSAVLLPAPGIPGEVETPEIVALAAEISQQIVAPLDAYEVTALLESTGITDEVARLHYGMRDVFDLAHVLLQYMKRHGMVRATIEAQLTPMPHTVAERLRDYAKGILGLAPPVLLLIALYLFGRWGSLAAEQVLVLGAGMTISLLATSGFIQAISYRTATYLSLRKPRMAGRYLAYSSGLVALALIAVIVLGTHILAQQSSIFMGARNLFVGAFIGLTIIWMAASGLALVGKSHWLSLGLAGGLLIGMATYAGTAPLLADFSQSAQRALAIILGYGTTVAIILYAAWRAYTAPQGTLASASVYNFPSKAYMAAESLPYFAYGAIYMVLILVPHLLGWLGHLYIGQDRAWSITSTEVGMTLSMPPLVLAYGVAEHALRRFWHTAALAQSTTPGTNVERFGITLYTFCAHHRRLYITAIIGLSLLTWIAFHAAADAGWLTAWLHVTDLSDLLFIFDMSLVAYALLGIGLFNCMFATTLQHPRVGVIAATMAVATLLAAGIQLAIINFALVPIAFVAAAAIFAAVSWILASQVLHNSDFSFASVI